MGWLSNFVDDVVGLDPNGGGVYGAARDVLGDTIADDVLGMDPNGGGAIKAYNVAIPAIAGYYGLDALGAFDAASSGTGLTSGGSGLGLSGNGYLGLQAPASAAGSTAAASSIPSWLSSLGGTAASYLTNPSNLTALTSVAGGLLGSNKNANTSSASQQYRMDSRLDPLVYGTPQSTGLLGESNALYKMQLSQGGLNDTQRQGLDMQRQALMSPSYTQGYDAMRNTGLGLLSTPMAGNPFQTGMPQLMPAGVARASQATQATQAAANGFLHDPLRSFRTALRQAFVGD